MGCVEDAPVFVFYNYHSVPLPPASVENLVHFVTSKLSGSLTRFIFCCDVRRTPSDVLGTVEALDKCEIEHFSLPRMNPFLSERIRRYASLVGSSIGAIALITDTGDFGKMMKDLAGWRVVLFYPPDSDKSLLENATQAFALPVHSVTTEEEVNPVHGQKGIDENVSQLVGAMMRTGCGGRKEDVLSDDSESLVGSAGSQPRNGWGCGPSPSPPPSAPFFFQRNGFDSPSFAQEPKSKPNPFNKNPFQTSGMCDNDGPFGKHRGNRNPFAQSSRFPGFRQEERTMPGETPTRPIGPQCPQWEDRHHRNNDNCQLWHPRKPCRFFPRCRLTAQACFYAHPFCNGGECMCGNGIKDPQLNHFS